jgi:hypothetical protein
LLRESQLWILNNPDQIPAIASSRGPNFGKVVQLADSNQLREGHKRSRPLSLGGLRYRRIGERKQAACLDCVRAIRPAWRLKEGWTARQSWKRALSQTTWMTR